MERHDLDSHPAAPSPDHAGSVLAAGKMPDSLPRRYHRRWRRPWSRAARRSPGFKRWLWNHGYLSPNFRKGEGASKPGPRCPAQSIPSSLRARAQHHAFKLEIARHRLGDRTMSPLSWYRSPCHNQEVGGATSSQHLLARATDWGPQPNQDRFDDVMRDVFSGGGIGSCSSGRVAHVDTRGYVARWLYGC